MNPVVSIVIPTFNRVCLLSKTLESISNQSYDNWECLIIDDGSDEENIKSLLNLVTKDGRFFYYSRPRNMIKGPSSCRNYGMSQAKGKFIQFFDDDDFMYPEMIQLKLSTIIRDNCDVVVAPLDFYNVKLKKKEFHNDIYSENIISDYFSGAISWYVSGPLWKKEFLKEEFDTAIQTLDDWDFNLRNIYRKPKISFLSIPLQKYNRYNIGQTLSTLVHTGDEKQIVSAFLVYKKHYYLLRKKKMLSNKLQLCIFRRIVPLLGSSLMNKQGSSKLIYDFFIKNLNLRGKMKFYKIIFGYHLYKFFGKGYRFIKF